MAVNVNTDLHQEEHINKESGNDVAMETTNDSDDNGIFCKACHDRLTCCLFNHSPETYVLLCINMQCKRTNMIRDAENVARLKGKSARLKEPGLEDLDDVLRSLDEFKEEMKKYVLAKKKKYLLTKNKKAQQMDAGRDKEQAAQDTSCTITIKEEVVDEYDEQCSTYEEYLKLPFQPIPTSVISRNRGKTVLQWQNESNLCWLDVITTMLVNSDVIRLQLNWLKTPGHLHYLCREFDRIQLQRQRQANFDTSWMRFEHTRDVLVIKLADMFNIKIGEMQCCMEMLKLFLDFDDSVKPTFTSYIKRSIECKECEYTEVGSKKVIGCLSIPHQMKTFHPLKCQYFTSCPECDAEGQTEEIEYKKIGPVIGMHLEKGFPHNRLHDYDFHMTVKNGRQIKYEVYAVIQYKRDSKHFILWIRNLTILAQGWKNPIRWMQFDDGDVEEATGWQNTPPIIPRHEIHMVMWSKKGARKLLRQCTQDRVGVGPFLDAVDCRNIDLSGREISFQQSEDEGSNSGDLHPESPEVEGSHSGDLHPESPEDEGSNSGDLHPESPEVEGSNSGDLHPESPEVEGSNSGDLHPESPEVEGSNSVDLHPESPEDQVSDNRKESTEKESPLVRRYGLRKRKLSGKVSYNETIDQESSEEDHDSTLKHREDCTENENSSTRHSSTSGGVEYGENLDFFRKLRIRPPITDDEMISEERCQELRERGMKMRDSTYMMMTAAKFEQKCEHFRKVHELFREEEEQAAAMKIAKAAAIEIPSGELEEDAKDRSIKVRRIANVVCIGYKDLEIPHIMLPTYPTTLPKITAPPKTTAAPKCKFSYSNKPSS